MIAVKSFLKSLLTVRRHSPNARIRLSSEAMDGGASLCQRESRLSRDLAKRRDLPARSRFGEGRGEILQTMSILFKDFY